MKSIALCLAALMVPALALAEIDVDASMNLLITPPSYSGCADEQFDWIDGSVCADLTSTAVAGYSFVWVVASDGENWPGGIGGIQFGIEYTASVTGWTLCTGGQEVSEDGWPASGKGNAVTWAGGCYDHDGGNARVGFFSLEDGATGGMTITADPRTGDAMYSDCVPASSLICPENLGWDEDFSDGIAPNCDTCPGTPTRETTWGRIKDRF